MQRAQEGLGVAALEVRVAVVVRRARAGGGREPGDPGLDHPERDDVAAQHRHGRGGQPVGLTVGEQPVDREQHPVGDDVEDHGQLVGGDVRRLREGGEGVRAVGHRVRPALAGHEAAQVALAEQPGREPVTPLEHLVARHQRPLVVPGDALAEDQRGEAAPEDRVGVLLAQADAEPGGHPVAEAREQVVVDAALDPRRQRGIGGAVARLGIGVAEHAGQLGGEVVEGPVLWDGQSGSGYLLPVLPGHDDHPAKGCRVSRLQGSLVLARRMCFSVRAIERRLR